jgi:hypothetical protein
VIVACALLLPSVVAADYTPDVRKMFLDHAQHKLGFSSVPVLARQTSSTRNGATRALRAVLQQVIETSPSAPASAVALAQVLYDPELVVSERDRMGRALFNAPGTKRLTAQIGGCEVIESEDATAINREGVFSLSVRSDGDAFELYNRLADYNLNDNRGAKLSDGEAAALARAFVVKAGILRGSELDQLVFFKTRFTHFTGNSGDPGDRIVGTSVYFGRQINGVPVVSAKGSRIVIEFAADRAISRVVVDWSPLVATTQTQRAVSASILRDRIAGEHAERLRNSLQTSGDFEITRVNCGYVDFGDKYIPATKELQLGCEVTSRPLDTDQPSILLVPLGDSVVPQAPWTSPDIAAAQERLAHDPSVSVRLYGLPSSNMTPSAPSGATP